MAVSAKIRGISDSPTLSLNAKVGAMKAAGTEVFNFTAGEPDFRTPANVSEAAIKAIRSGFTKYTPVPGTPELRRAIAEKLRKENGVSWDAENVIVTNGGKQALYNAFMAICEPGDEVVMPSPYWVTYPEQVKLAGARPVFAEASKSDGFALKAKDIERCLTKKTKAILLNSPNNPTGAVCERKELQKIAELALGCGAYVVSDEIYEHLVYEGEHVSMASLGDEIREKTITVNGAAKAYSMTGWRLGWAAGPADVIKGMGKLQAQTTSNANSIAQMAYLEAITGSQESVRSMLSEFRKRGDLMVKALCAVPGVGCARPAGAFYVFPDVSGCFGSDARDSLSFASRLLEKEKVAVVPGSAFGCEGHVRMSYACSMETIEKGIAAMKRFCEAL